MVKVADDSAACWEQTGAPDEMGVPHGVRPLAGGTAEEIRRNDATE